MPRAPGHCLAWSFYRDSQGSRILSILRRGWGYSPGLSRVGSTAVWLKALCLESNSPGFKPWLYHLIVLRCIHISDPHFPHLSSEDKCYSRDIPSLSVPREGVRIIWCNSSKALSIIPGTYWALGKCHKRIKKDIQRIGLYKLCVSGTQEGPPEGIH